VTIDNGFYRLAPRRSRADLPINTSQRAPVAESFTRIPCQTQNATPIVSSVGLCPHEHHGDRLALNAMARPTGKWRHPALNGEFVDCVCESGRRNSLRAGSP
jgi:hypothetical protein